MTALALPKKVDRNLLAAEGELARQDTRLAAHIEDLTQRLRDAEARRDLAVANQNALIRRRQELARAVDGNTLGAAPDLIVLREHLRQVAAEFEAVVMLARDAVEAVRAERANNSAQLQSLRRNADRLRAEVEVGQIMQVKPPAPSCRTLAASMECLLPLDFVGSGNHQVAKAQRLLQRAHDAERLQRGAPMVDLPTLDIVASSDVFEDDALISRREAAFERALVDSHEPSSPRPRHDIHQLLSRAATLSAARRRPRGSRLSRIVFIGLAIYLLILAGAFIGRALA